MTNSTNAFLERFDGRHIFRLYLGSEAATALAVTPAPNGRVFIDTSSPQVASIQLKAGWFVIQGSANARQQYYINPEHIVGIVWDTDQDMP